MNEQWEPEILSYREFKNRETLLAWERRRRALESQPGSERLMVGAHVQKQNDRDRHAQKP